MIADSVVIVAARRTPLGSFQGALSAVAATELSATATRAALADCGLDASEVDEEMLGCV